ncbi:hypothetical protein L1049_006225 [Liquidambar formosana]|uniref:F-box domain-containing protein n=1 Tax=Liquidambar formosana TaxID=63359 RepID=A0AAP0RFK6_LIQFO
MEWETSWIDHDYDDGKKETKAFDSYLELSDEECKENNLISIDLVLPDDLLERILAYLPLASIFKAGCVCKKWNEIIRSRRFLWNISTILGPKPWYFMFTSSDEPVGHVYDPMVPKWYSFELPDIGISSWFIASSCGLVCFMDNDSRSELYVFNPITKSRKKLKEPPDSKFSDYSTLAMSVDRSSHSYTVTVIRSNQAPGDFIQWDLSLHVYYSETMTWVSHVAETLTGWRGGDDSVICGGLLYFLVHSTRGMGWTGNRHGLVSYNLSGQSSGDALINSFIPVPCPLTCGRLMNLKDKLVMVGGIGRKDRLGIIKGIGIWVLNGRDWEEVSRMPHKFFQGFGELDDVFASSGSNDFIYIQSYGGPALAVFDMHLKQWKWSQKCPVTKRFPLQLYSGFCFEPRFEVSP